MATEIKLRRGTTAEHASFNGAEGEVTFDTDLHTLIVHNNAGNGTGERLAKYSELGSALTVEDAGSDTTMFPLLSTDATGAINPKTDTSSLTYNAATGALSSTTFVGALTGNATTATTATNVVVTDNESTSENNAIVFVADADLDGSTSTGLESDGNLTYNPSTGTVTATGFSGNLSGTLQTAAQTNITSVGDLTALNVNGTVTADGITNAGAIANTGTLTNTGDVTIISTSTSDADVPLLTLERAVDDSTGNAFHDLGSIIAKGVDLANTDNRHEYAEIDFNASTDTAGSEAGRIIFKVSVSGASPEQMASERTDGFFIEKKGVFSKDGATNAHTSLVPTFNTDSTNINVNLPSSAGTLALTSDITVTADSTTTFTNKTIGACQLSGTIDNARLPSAATNITSLGTLTGLTTGATTVNGALTVNDNSVEIVSTDAGASINPILSLYRNSASPAVSDDLGAIQFHGEDDAGNKTLYAQIHANIEDETNSGTHEDGQIHFSCTSGGSLEDPTMVLTRSSLQLQANNDLILGQNVFIRFETDGNDAHETILYAVQATQDNTVLLPNASGTLPHIAENGGLQHPVLSSDPSSPANGQTYYNSSTHKLRLYANGAFVDLN